MLVRFTKNAPAAKADTLDCFRPDGTSTLPRPEVEAVELDRVRAAPRELGVACRLLLPGHSLERTF